MLIQLSVSQLNNANNGLVDGQYNNNNHRREVELIRQRSKDKNKELDENEDDRSESNGHITKNLYQVSRI